MGKSTSTNPRRSARLAGKAEAGCTSKETEPCRSKEACSSKKLHGGALLHFPGALSELDLAELDAYLSSKAVQAGLTDAVCHDSGPSRSVVSRGVGTLLSVSILRPPGWASASPRGGTWWMLVVCSRRRGGGDNRASFFSWLSCGCRDG